jgi:hypothetical protein
MPHGPKFSLLKCVWLGHWMCCAPMAKYRQKAAAYHLSTKQKFREAQNGKKNVY